MAGGFKVHRGRPSAPAVPSMTQTLKAFGKKLLITGAAATALATVPVGNAVALTVDPTIEVTTGTVFTELADAKITPSAAWTGALGSGFTAWAEDGNARTMTPDKSAAQGNGTGALGDQTRTTAKPILQIGTPWNCQFTGKIYIPVKSVAAGALTKVRGYCEGGVVDVTQRCNYRYTDVNGVEKWINDCYLFCLDAADWLSKGVDNTRQIRLFFRAYAADGTMQTQLIGVGTTTSAIIAFNPRAVAHDVLVQVTPSAGADSKPNGAYPAVNAIFRTLQDALSYIAGQTRSGFTIASPAKAARIEVTETCSLNLTSLFVSDYHSAIARHVITTSAGVTATIGKTSFDTATQTDPFSGATYVNYQWLPGVSNLEWRGSGIVFDATNYAGGGSRSSSYHPDWMNGVTIGCSSINLRQFVWKTRDVYDNAGTIGASFMTDCDTTYMVHSFILMSRNNVLRDGYDDIFNQTPFVYGNLIDGWGANFHTVYHDALTISYSGAGTTAVLSKTGGNGTGSGTVQLVVDGSTVATSLTLGSLGTITALRDWINTQTGWTATLVGTFVPNDGVTDRTPIYLSHLTLGFNAFTTANCKGSPQTVGTYIDVHVDFYQFQGLLYVNKLIEANKAVRLQTVQTFFADGGAQDVAFICNAFENTPNGVGGQFARRDPFSFSHFIIRGNSDPGTSCLIGTDELWDSYCRFENNVFGNFGWLVGGVANGGNPGANPVITNCHFITLSNPVNQGDQVSVGVTSGSTVAALYPNLASEDFSPGGPLLTSQVAKVADYDAFGAKVPSTTVRGAKAVAQGSASLTVAQAMELAAITANDTVGIGVGHITLTWNSGAGETGSPVSFVINFDVAA